MAPGNGNSLEGPLHGTGEGTLAFYTFTHCRRNENAGIASKRTPCGMASRERPKQKAGGISATRLMQLLAYSGLELLVQAHVPVTVTDRVIRSVVVVVERSQDRGRLAIKGVVHAHGNAGAPEDPLPDRCRHGFGHRRVLGILRLLHIRSRLRRRLHELVAQLQVES